MIFYIFSVYQLIPVIIKQQQRKNQYKIDRFSSLKKNDTLTAFVTTCFFLTTLLESVVILFSVLLYEECS